MATVVDAHCISEGSYKETNHYAVSIRGSGIRYKPGDSMGFYPANDAKLAKDTVRAIGAKKDIIVETKETGEIELFDALLNRFTIHRAGKKFLSAVVSKMKKGKDKDNLNKILVKFVLINENSYLNY